MLLLGVGMPMKYFFDLPIGTKLFGWPHGVLFVWFILALLGCKASNKLNIGQSALALLASLLPFGTFVLDAKLLKQLDSST